jgi:leucyl aminopeptidase
MDFQARVQSVDRLSQTATDVLVVVLAGDLSRQQLDAPLAALLAEAVASGDLQAKPGKTLYLHRPHGVKAKRVIFSVAADAGAKACGSAVAAALAPVKAVGVKQLSVVLASGGAVDAAFAEAVAVTVADGLYVYRHTKPSAAAASALQGVTLLVDKGAVKAATAGLVRGSAIAAGMTFARECANRPANHCTPSHLASEAKRLAKAHGFKVDVLERKDCEKLGMGSFLCVAQGSYEPLKFIVLRYEGAAKGSAPVVLVGKGITFDTGGISIKPSAEMDEMKFDMGGAASVLGTFRALGDLKPRLNVVGLIPTCENMPSGRSVKPGDVVTSMSGQTIEVLNTDAEGRLILCDALTYAERFKPSAVIDIATLTGACVIALGHHRSGLFSTDDALAEQLLSAATAALDPAWRLPLDDEYGEALKSNFADMGNVGGRAGGAITAAMFLKKFTAKYPWAHLDIAGTAWKSGAAKGATGRPVPLLTHYLLSRAG